MNLYKTGSAQQALTVLACFENIFGDGGSHAGDTIFVGFTSIKSLCAIEISNEPQQRKAWVSGHKIGDSYTVWLARHGEYDFDDRASPNYSKSRQYLFAHDDPYKAAQAIFDFIANNKLPKEEGITA